MKKAPNKMMPDTMAPELKFNLDFGWINHIMLRSDVSATLDSIRVNYRPHASCHVQNNDYSGDYYGWLIFPNDSAMHKANIVQSFPNEYSRLIYTFKYWNIIRYFNPNNDITDIPWDTTLYKNILYIANAKNAIDFYFGIRRFSSRIDDAHSEGLTSAYYISPPTYYYAPKIILRYIENKYTVVSSNVNSIKKGDLITAVNNISVSAMEDSLRPYISAGNPAVFHRTMCSYILNGYPNTNVKIDFTDSAGIAKNITTQRATYIYDNYFFSYYPNDTLSTVSYKEINCNIGYVNMGNLINSEVNSMYNDLRFKDAIIFDIRNYPNGTIFNIANLMFPEQIKCALFKIPNVNYPGTFEWDASSFGFSNSNSFQGKVLILVNQETQSQAEYSAMILKAMPGAFIVGSQTAGADGNISYFNISRDLTAGFSTLGVYFPDGTNTQRIGIVPDTICTPTRSGIQKNRDEVLNFALKLAGCNVSSLKEITKDKSITLFPNPNNGRFILQSSQPGIQYVQIIDVTGKVIYNTDFELHIELDLSELSNGIYSAVVTSKNSIETRQFIIVK
ncbi:MAG: S41 family peptidase [Bacteroidota bacterium]